MSLESKLEFKEINLEIEEMVKKYNISYLDAVIHFCEEKNIEIESIGSIIKKNQKIFSSIQEEAENLNFLPKTSRLDI